MLSTRRLIVFVVVVAVAVAVVLYLVASPRSVVPPGAYVGLSSQRLPINLIVAKDGRLSVDVSWSADCGPELYGRVGAVIQRTVKSRTVAIAPDGSFSWRGTLDDGGAFGERWRLRGRRGRDARSAVHGVRSNTFLAAMSIAGARPARWLFARASAAAYGYLLLGEMHRAIASSR